jgi:hypothetical protein
MEMEEQLAAARRAAAAKHGASNAAVGPPVGAAPPAGAGGVAGGAAGGDDASLTLARRLQAEEDARGGGGGGGGASDSDDEVQIVEAPPAKRPRGDGGGGSGSAAAAAPAPAPAGWADGVGFRLTRVDALLERFNRDAVNLEDIFPVRRATTHVSVGVPKNLNERVRAACVRLTRSFSRASWAAGRCSGCCFRTTCTSFPGSSKPAPRCCPRRRHARVQRRVP